MAIDRRTSTPLYVQLKDAVVSEIRAGDLKPGDRVGSESELERLHGVSRITVRQALKALVQEGALYRVPGKGTYVASRKVAPLAAFTSFSENMLAQGLTPSYRLLDARLVDPPTVARQELRLGEHDHAWRIERLLLADGEPMGLQDGFYPARLFGSNRHYALDRPAANLEDVLDLARAFVAYTLLVHSDLWPRLTGSSEHPHTATV